MVVFDRFHFDGSLLASGVYPPDVIVRLVDNGGRPRALVPGAPAGASPAAEAAALAAWHAPRREALRAIAAYASREGLSELAALSQGLDFQLENPSLSSIHGTVRLLRTLAAADPARAARCEAEVFLTVKILEMMGEDAFEKFPGGHVTRVTAFLAGKK